MASKSKRARMAPERNLLRFFLFWAIGIFIIKLGIIFRMEGINVAHGDRVYFVDGAWLGADGENYISAYTALVKDGIFSPETLLHYWPAGYPIFLLALSFLGKSWLFTTLTILQSVVYSASVYYFTYQLSKTKIRNYSFLVLLFLLLNPTLSLASLCIGYESLAASGLLTVLGLLIQDLTSKSNKVFHRNIIASSLTIGFITIFQPRLLLSGLIGIAIWILVRKPIKSAVLMMILSTAIVAISPSFLMLRNQKANGFTAISTNLGTTMNLGAGDEADGSYRPKDKFGVPCSPIEGNPAQQDSHLVRCVISWYLSNPIKTVELLINKAVFFWSPWFGPEAVGSMARNPWLTVSPLVDIAANSQEGAKLVYGTVGKIVSWIWMLASLVLLIIGFWRLWRIGGIEKLIGLVVITHISLNWLIAMGTLGDHRQRLPILGLSIFLQAVGVKTMFKGKGAALVDGPLLPPKIENITIRN
jgi:hypothetical protein